MTTAEYISGQVVSPCTTGKQREKREEPYVDIELYGIETAWVVYSDAIDTSTF